MREPTSWRSLLTCRHHCPSCFLFTSRRPLLLAPPPLHPPLSLIPLSVIGCCPPTLPSRWWQLPYYWAGIKMYDLVAGIQCLKSSYVLSKSKALELFPMLKKDKLVGAIVYYDGQSLPTPRTGPTPAQQGVELEKEKLFDWTEVESSKTL